MEALRYRLDVMNEVRRLVLLVSSRLDVENALEIVAEGVARLLPAGDCALYLCEGGRGSIRRIGGAALSDRARIPAATMASFAERLLSVAQPWNVLHEGEASICGASILVEGKAVGALVAVVEAGSTFDVVLYQDVLCALADCAANTVENARQYESMRQRAQHLSALVQIGRETSAVTDLGKVLDTIVESAARLAQAGRCSLMLVDEQTWTMRIRAARGVLDTVIESAAVRVGEGVAGHVAATGEPLLIADITADPRFVPMSNTAQFNTNSLLSVPLKIGQRVLGVLNVNNKASATAFTQADEELLTLLASHAAVAIENAGLYERLEKLAATDGLTGLYNHQHFYFRLRQAVSFARRVGLPISVLMLDVDHFKQVNDTYGHSQGDTVLRAAAVMLQRCARREDVAARYGGEEFAVIVSNTDVIGTAQMAERIRHLLGDLAFEGRGRTFRVTLSAGVAGLEEGMDGDQLVDCADLALYRAKRSGRNRVCVYDPELDRPVEHES